MKMFQVEDKNAEIIECVLQSISMCPQDKEIDCFCFGMVFEDQTYSTGFTNASPSDIAKVAGYLQLDAALRYVALNKDKINEDDE